MYEYIRLKQTSDHKSGASHDVTQRKTISFGSSYAYRNTKTGYYPRQETRGVIQMGRSKQLKCRWCRKPSYRCSCEYRPRRYYEQYLDPGKLRSNLGADKYGGEAHHIIPGNIVEKEKWVDKKIAPKDYFNEAWNGIMLNGTRSLHGGGIINKLKVNKRKLRILHRKGGQHRHFRYDYKVRALIDQMNIKNSLDCEIVANKIRIKIMADNAASLDDLIF